MRGTFLKRTNKHWVYDSWNSNLPQETAGQIFVSAPDEQTTTSSSQLSVGQAGETQSSAKIKYKSEENGMKSSGQLTP